MTTEITLHAYIINLEKSTDRMAHMRQEIEALGVPYTRIEAVYGPDLPEPIQGFDEKRFNLLTGKHKNSREIGCYLSHINAFKAFLASSASHALILEDDVHLPRELTTLLDRAIEHQAHWDLLRLSSSRQGQFIKITQLDATHQLAYNLKVLKNTGAYLITRKGAEACLNKMLPMCLPYDVALDRDWDIGIKTACIDPMPVELEDFPTQIIHKAKRIRRYRATTFHIFHLITRIQRKAYRRKLAQRAGIQL
tara:strand:- start:4853 stop:5605 length:753 start_codon:yes stop_codon:yes gene_type:complete